MMWFDFNSSTKFSFQKQHSTYHYHTAMEQAEEEERIEEATAENLDDFCEDDI